MFYVFKYNGFDDYIIEESGHMRKDERSYAIDRKKTASDIKYHMMKTKILLFKFS